MLEVCVRAEERYFEHTLLINSVKHVDEELASMIDVYCK